MTENDFVFLEFQSPILFLFLHRLKIHDLHSIFGQLCSCLVYQFEDLFCLLSLLVKKRVKLNQFSICVFIVYCEMHYKI